MGQFGIEASLGPSGGDVGLANGTWFCNSGEKSEPKRIAVRSKQTSKNKETQKTTQSRKLKPNIVNNT